jgi:hypothetical protein
MTKTSIAAALASTSWAIVMADSTDGAHRTALSILLLWQELTTIDVRPGSGWPSRAKMDSYVTLPMTTGWPIVRRLK